MSTRRSITRSVLLLLAMILAPSTGAPIAGANGDALPKLYWVDESFERVIQPMDPMSLADTGAPMSLATGSATDTSFLLSADGSTAVLGHVTIEGTNWSLNLRVLDAETGAERAAFPAEGRDAYVVSLSRDGGRVVVSTTEYDKRARLYATVWTVHDTRTGKSISSFDLTHRDGQWFTAYVDGAAEHLWLQSSTVDETHYSTKPKMGSLVLRHIDLARGRETGRLTLGSVEVGTVARDTVDQVPVFESVYPTIALAPDGRTLAVVEAATEEVVLLDGLSMTRIATFAVHQPQSLAHRLLGWTGLLPTSAAAKLQVGEWRSVTFSADGDSLYLTGGRGEITGNTYEDYEAEWLGIRRVNLDTGEVRAEALDGMQIDSVVATSNGDLYVLGPERPWTDIAVQPGATVVSRLDAETLDVEATRTLDGSVWTVLVTEA